MRSFGFEDLRGMISDSGYGIFRKKKMYLRFEPWRFFESINSPVGASSWSFDAWRMNPDLYFHKNFYRRACFFQNFESLLRRGCDLFLVL